MPVIVRYQTALSNGEKFFDHKDEDVKSVAFANRLLKNHLKLLASEYNYLTKLTDEAYKMVDSFHYLKVEFIKQ